MEKKKFRLEKVWRYSINVSLLKEELVDAVFARVCAVVEDIVEEADVEVSLTDEGIGEWECHGQRGYHRDWQHNVTRWRPDVELLVYCPTFILADEKDDVQMSIEDAIHEEGMVPIDADDGAAIDCRLVPTIRWDDRHMAFKVTFEWEVDRWA